MKSKLPAVQTGLTKVKSVVRGLGDEAGTTMVEFAIVAVLLLTIVTLVAEGGILFGSWIAITNGAREGARYGAPCLNRDVETCSKDDVIARVGETTAGMIDKSSGYFVTVSYDDTAVTVTVTCTVTSVSPLIGNIPLSAQSVMRLENSQ